MTTSCRNKGFLFCHSLSHTNDSVGLGLNCSTVQLVFEKEFQGLMVDDNNHLSLVDRVHPIRVQLMRDPENRQAMVTLRFQIFQQKLTQNQLDEVARCHLEKSNHVLSPQE